MTDAAKAEFKTAKDQLSIVPIAAMVFATAKLSTLKDGYFRDDSTLDLHPEDVGELGKLLRLTAFWIRAKNCLQNRKYKRGVTKLIKADMSKYKDRNATILKKNDLRKIEPISYEERQQALRDQLFLMQRESFRRSMADVAKYGYVNNKSSLKDAAPVFDETGLFRVSSRTAATPFLAPEQQYPVIIHPDHPLAALIIRDVHCKFLRHGNGPSGCHTAVANEFYILRGKEKVKKTLRGCVTCRHINARGATQIMSTLPAFRVQEGTERLTPFASCSMDVFGPFWTQTGRGLARQKRWALIWVCAQYRAISIELLASMSSEELVKSINLILARRPCPRRIISDNGTNFVGLSNALKKQQIGINRVEIANRFPNIEWKFIPKAASHQAGSHEIMVKLAKTGLYKVMKPGRLTDHDLRGLMAEVENSVNNRPISFLSSSPKDLAPLTPNHFLLGSTAAEIATIPYDPIGKTFGEKYQLLEQCKKEYWQIFLKELIANMRLRPKWQKERPTIKKGDIVVYLHPELKPNEYPLGRVEDVIVSHDGYIRSAIIRHSKSAKNEHIPITQLSLMPLSASPENIAVIANPDKKEAKSSSVKTDGPDRKSSKQTAPDPQAATTSKSDPDPPATKKAARTKLPIQPVRRSNRLKAKESSSFKGGKGAAELAEPTKAKK